MNGDRIYNGAVDNAVGTAGILEIARAFTKLPTPPKRSILFLAVTAEEQGLLGSQYYAVQPIYPLAKTAAVINIDTLNVHGRTKDLTLVGYGASDLDDYARDAAGEQGRVIRPDPEPEKGFYYRSDHFNFAKQGVPALDPDEGVDFVGKPPEYSVESPQPLHRARLPQAVRHRPARLGPERRARGSESVLRGRLPRRRGRQVPGVEAGQRVQSDTRGGAEEVEDSHARPKSRRLHWLSWRQTRRG